MDIVAVIAGVFKSLANGLALMLGRQSANNTPAMQKADEAKKDAELRDAAAKVIEKEDVRKTQELLSD